MTLHTPFQPRQGANAVVSPAASSAESTIGKGNKSIRFSNSGANICYVRVGTGTQTATTADMPVLSGESIVIEKAEAADTVAYISASGTTLNIQPGEGGF